MTAIPPSAIRDVFPPANIEIVSNESLSLDRIPMPDAPLEDILRFAASFDGSYKTGEYSRGCLPEEWNDSPKSLTKLRSVLYAGFVLKRCWSFQRTMSKAFWRWLLMAAHGTNSKFFPTARCLRD